MVKSVLFLCVHNSARSQMAEAYLKKSAQNKFIAESAGLEAGELNPLAVEVMREDGIDISHNRTKNVFDLHAKGNDYDYVITVCDANSSALCPVFPGRHKKLHWDLADPSGFTGSYTEKLELTRVVRDQIKKAVRDFIISCEK